MYIASIGEYLRKCKKDMEKILTIVVPAYNVEKYLYKTIRSFLSEEILNDLEIIIVNDGSSDGTARIANEFEKEHRETIRVINKKNGGHGSTINTGIKFANGNYFKVVDGDDWVETVELVKLVKKLKEEQSDIVLTPFKKVFVNSDQEQSVEILRLKDGERRQLKEVICGLKDSYQIHSITFKTDILRKIPKITEDCFYVDQEYCLYPLLYAETISFYDYNVYRYRMGSTEQSMNILNMQKRRNMHKQVILDLLNYYRKWMKTDSEKKEFLKYRIGKLEERQIQILLSLSISKVHKEELGEFLDEIRKWEPQIYKQIPGKKAWFIRTIGVKAYWFLAIWQKGAKKIRMKNEN